jgi:hypothetical protein
LYNYCQWYLLVHLCINWISKAFRVHRLVANEFISNPHNKPQVNHIDWNKQNNCVSNLERATRSENMKHSFSIWLHKSMKFWLWKIWKDHPLSVKVKQIDLDWNIIKIWDSFADISRELWHNHSTFVECCNWKQKTAYWFRREYLDINNKRWL